MKHHTEPALNKHVARKFARTTARDGPAAGRTGRATVVPHTPRAFFVVPQHRCAESLCCDIKPHVWHLARRACAGAAASATHCLAQRAQQNMVEHLGRLHALNHDCTMQVSTPLANRLASVCASAAGRSRGIVDEQMPTAADRCWRQWLGATGGRVGGCVRAGRAGRACARWSTGAPSRAAHKRRAQRTEAE